MKHVLCCYFIMEIIIIVSSIDDHQWSNIVLSHGRNDKQVYNYIEYLEQLVSLSIGDDENENKDD